MDDKEMIFKGFSKGSMHILVDIGVISEKALEEYAINMDKLTLMEQHFTMKYARDILGHLADLFEQNRLPIAWNVQRTMIDISVVFNSLSKEKMEEALKKIDQAEKEMHAKHIEELRAKMMQDRQDAESAKKSRGEHIPLD